MKIAVVQPRLSYFSGGGEKIPLESIYYTSSFIKSVFFDVYTTKSPLQYSPGYLKFKRESESLNNIKIHELTTPEKFRSLYDIIPGENRYRWDAESLYFNNLVYPFIDENKPDLIVSYYLPDCLVKPNGVPSILYLLGYPRVDSEYREAMLNQYDGVIANSQNTIDQWNLHLTKKIVPFGVLQQGLDLTLVPKKIVGFDDNTFNIVFVGRLIKRKGIMTLLEATKDVLKQVEDARLYILGEGPVQKEIESYISSNNLGKNIRLVGFRANVVDYMASANLCVFPSYAGEGLMNVVLESMYYNGLVLSTKGNGNEEVISDGQNGYLVNPKNINELENKIVEIIENSSNLSDIREKAKSAIAEKFTWKKHSETFYNFCNKVKIGT